MWSRPSFDAVKSSQPVREWRDEALSVSWRSKFDGSKLLISDVHQQDVGKYRLEFNQIIWH